MNLLVSKRIGWLLTVSVLLIGCKEEEGLQVTPEVQKTKIEYIEFNLPASNIYIDSLRTDEGSSLLVGEYSDDIVGSVQSTGYSEFFYREGPLPYFFFDNGNLIIDERNLNFDSMRFESLSVTMRIAEFVHSSDPLVQNLEFYELEDSIFQNVLYLADRELPLGRSLGNDTKTFNPLGLSLIDLEPDSIVTVYTLDDTYGEELFDRIASIDPEDIDSIASSLLEKRIRFPGIGFVSNGSTGIINYDLSSSFTNLELRMRPLKSDSIYVIKFLLSGANNFNHIVRDRDGSEFASVDDRRSLDVSSDFVYFNPIAGILPRIDLSPYLDFAEENEAEQIIVQRAQLSIGAETSEIIPNVENVKYYFSNEDNSNLADVVYNINWAGIAVDPISTLLQTDNTYLGSLPLDLTSTIDSATNVYMTFPNVFFQDILDQTQEGEKLYSDDLIMVSPVNTLSKSIIIKDSIKLQIFYVKLN